jgi:hypothetical protein
VDGASLDVGPDAYPGTRIVTSPAHPHVVPPVVQAAASFWHCTARLMQLPDASHPPPMGNPHVSPRVQSLALEHAVTPLAQRLPASVTRSMHTRAPGSQYTAMQSSPLVTQGDAAAGSQGEPTG